MKRTAALKNLFLELSLIFFASSISLIVMGISYCFWIANYPFAEMLCCGTILLSISFIALTLFFYFSKLYIKDQQIKELTFFNLETKLHQIFIILLIISSNIYSIAMTLLCFYPQTMIIHIIMILGISLMVTTFMFSLFSFLVIKIIYSNLFPQS